MSKLLDELLSKRTLPGPSCGVAIALEDLDADDPEFARQVRECLEHPRVQSTDLARVLKERGIPLSHYTIQRHRRGDCSCDE